MNSSEMTTIELLTHIDTLTSELNSLKIEFNSLKDEVQAIEEVDIITASLNTTNNLEVRLAQSLAGIVSK